jgi:hypothetical protein
MSYPKPRYPKVPSIRSVEDLMPYARLVAGRDGCRPGVGPTQTGTVWWGVEAECSLQLHPSMTG